MLWLECLFKSATQASLVMALPVQALTLPRFPSSSFESVEFGAYDEEAFIGSSDKYSSDFGELL